VAIATLSNSFLSITANSCLGGLSKAIPTGTVQTAIGGIERVSIKNPIYRSFDFLRKAEGGGIHFYAGPQNGPQGWESFKGASEWPPPKPLFGGTYDMTTGHDTGMNDNAIHIVAPYLPKNPLPIELSTKIALLGDQSIIRFDQTVINKGQDSHPFTPWFVGQLNATPNATNLYIGQPDDAIRCLMGECHPFRKQSALPIWKAFHTGNPMIKVGAKAKWIAMRSSNNVYSVLRHSHHVHGLFELFMADHAPYVELEALGRVSALQPGESNCAVFDLCFTTAPGDIRAVHSCGIYTNPFEVVKHGNALWLEGGYGVFQRQDLVIIENDSPIGTWNATPWDDGRRSKRIYSRDGDIAVIATDGDVSYTMPAKRR